ncbi:MAG: CPBP family intramembrane glutamic endopeptidase [Deltaproteobacteria bacterium]
MTSNQSPKERFLLPMVAYVAAVGAIVAAKFALPPAYVFPATSAVLLLTPVAMNSDIRGLRWDLRGIIIGAAASAAILAVYVIAVGKPINLERVSLSLILTHLLLVSFPEEVFFRGYLQEKFGDSLKCVAAVSLLFALAHIASRCIAAACAGGGIAEAALTFFPSLVMGYMYAYTKTLWSNIIFHFAANVVYTATGGL